ncbi:hypothetical protein [Bradyrhizobium sp.]|uniref:hypothetical protein n=1 Tax=Bradyrhizobium sp. TaxID=376 RepID=UPI002D646C16|nr:hypothetical protein [Bradyrhizobium sp.]HZR77014.1 hypothetical protein [Bradyrhizobium sp.]
MTKTALLSILVASWIAGLLAQFDAWDATLRYLVLSLLIVAAFVLKNQYTRQPVRSTISKRKQP